MSALKQALDLQTEPDSAVSATTDPANETMDLTGELDPTLLLLELRNSFILFREEMRHEMRAVRADTEFTRRYMKRLGLRLTAVESDKEQIEEDMRILASGTPPPIPFTSDEEALP